ncbi:hypothetical protein Aduo_008877 [Ancylostoma duodenale]|uniref:Uncharacterized protein n=1 Tax=Ancylostoma caninum TaxID=29170 RepID=A0A368H121_ANCCA|nr:hypothetical protein ANCCAN_04419 [Ancylostoma caninum]
MIRAVSACFPGASLPPLSFCLFQSADCDRKRVVSLASRAHKRLASTHPAPIFCDPQSSAVAPPHTIMDMLYSVCFKNRERVEEERWTRGRPVAQPRYSQLSERIPVHRVVEDYRRSDYRYDDHGP